MFERTRVDNAPEASAVPVEVVLADGTLTKGKLLVSAGKTLSDALNGTTAFIEFEPYGGERAFLSKAQLASVQLVGVPKAANLSARTRDGDSFNPHAILGVLGWATCFRLTREDVAAYLLSCGAQLNLWTAIALDRGDEVRAMIAGEPSLLSARMTRNQHRRTPLHHAAAKNRIRIVQLLLELGADPNATDATGATTLTTAAQEDADAMLIQELLAAGARLDFLTAVNLRRYGEAETMLRQDPSRIGPDGCDTIALHLAVNKKNLASIRWLIAHGVAVSAKRPMWDCNSTALHMTIEDGAIEIARLLLDAGADPNIRDDKYKATALGWAEYFDRQDFAVLMQEHGGQR